MSILLYIRNKVIYLVIVLFVNSSYSFICFLKRSKQSRLIEISYFYFVFLCLSFKSHFPTSSREYLHLFFFFIESSYRCIALSKYCRSKSCFSFYCDGFKVSHKLFYFTHIIFVISWLYTNLMRI